jgi:hypothetical protein
MRRSTDSIIWDIAALEVELLGCPRWRWLRAWRWRSAVAKLHSPPTQAP